VLLDLLLVKGHPIMGPEIRRQLIAGRARALEKMMQVDDLMME